MNWSAYVATCVRDHHGVASVRSAAAAGIASSTFLRRTRREGWDTPYPQVRIVPGIAPNPRTDIVAFIHSTEVPAAASSGSALWLRGLLDDPPPEQQVAVSQGLHRKPARGVRMRKARWLRPDDIDIIDGVPTLRPPATFVTVASWGGRQLRALILDAIQREVTTLEAISGRLTGIGAVPGIGDLRRLVFDLQHNGSESIFHDDVLQVLWERGYRPTLAPVPVASPDRRGLLPDVSLPWDVIVDIVGDRYHRSRDQRRKDRRRYAQYAGTNLRVVPVDWLDWQRDRESVLAAIDAAILVQWKRGIGREQPLPPHLRAQVDSTG